MGYFKKDGSYHEWWWEKYIVPITWWIVDNLEGLMVLLFTLTIFAIDIYLIFFLKK